VTKRLACGAALRFWVCIAMLLIRKSGRPSGSKAYGINDPKGNPACLRDSVERVAMEVSETRVRTRSAWLGSGS
jgi:hypothetical protein